MILNMCKNYLSKKTFTTGFLLTYDRMRRYEGSWHLERHLLFPAQIFLESENGDRLSEELRRYFDLDGKGNKLLSVDPEAEMFLKRLCGENGNLRMSEGIIQKGVPYICKGPLKGMEDRICKIDRHRRLVKLGTAMETIKGEEASGKWRFQYILAGLEITGKIL